MATALENVTTAIDNVAAILAEITANPKPDYSIDGQSVSWTSYYATLTQRMKDLLDIQIWLSGPYEYRTQVIN
jgi:hypothetical protein